VKVLIFSAYDPIPSDPAEPIRYARIAEEFLKHGHEVLYITSSFFHLTKSYRKLHTWQKDSTPEKLELHYLKARPYRKNAGSARLQNHYQLGKRLKQFLQKLPANRYPQLIITASPPLTTAGIISKWAQKHKIPYIYDIQDLWPEEFLKFIAYPSLGRKLLSRSFKQAHQLVKQATAISAVSRDYLDYYKNAISNKACRVFHLGTNTEKFEEARPAKGPYWVACLGNSQAGMYLDELAQAVQQLPETELLIAGLGNKTEQYSKHFTLCKYKRTHFSEWLSSDEMRTLLPGFAVGIILVHPRSKSAFPNRSLTYWSAGLPIVSNIEGGEMEQLIRSENLGITIKDISPESIKEAIQYCIDTLIDEHERIQQFARQHFNRDEIYANYYRWAMQFLDE
jgi:glycosyltransferase involved in cell wall biosynthesis